MKDYSSIFPIEKMCKAFNVHRSSYYSWLKRKPGSRDLYNRDLSEKIRGIYQESRKTYESPRITITLRNGAIIVENKLNRDFTVDGTGKVWVSDITYIRT